MRTIGLFAAGVVTGAVIGIGTWIGVRALTPAGALASSVDQPIVMMTGAKGLPTSHDDDYEIVVY